MTFDSIPVPAGFRSRQVCEAYNEHAFRHFLAVERVRARRSRRFLLLVLVAIRQSPGHRARLTNATSAALFRGLGASIREVDFMGWYFEGQVAAAVLAQGAEASDREVSPSIAARVETELKKQLSPTESKDLRVRIIRLAGTTHV